MIIKLIDHSFKWYKDDKVAVIGYAFKDEVLLKEESFSSYIKKALDKECTLESILDTLNGFFAIVIEEKDKVYLCCDRTRSLPLFYFMDGNEVKISNFAKVIVENSFKLDEESAEEFLYTSFVTGSDTLIKNLKMVQAGEVVTINKESYEIEKKSYYEFHHEEYMDISKEQLLNIIHKKYMDAFKRLLTTIDNKTIVVPLSGGYDSRIIVQMLYLLNYKNVICFCYGIACNKEVEISKKVAEHFNFKWIFIEYTKEKVREMYNSREQCEDFAANYVSLAHFQDYIAVKELKEKKLIPEDAIFVPGHSGDFIAGSHINKAMTENRKKNNSINNEIIKEHYNLFRIKNKKIINKKLEKNYKTPNSNKIKDNISHFEKFDWKERQCKFIINSVRIYEFFNFQWRIPLWDSELVELWCKIDYKYRFNRELYKEYAQWLELSQGLHIVNEKKSNGKSKIKNIAKKIVKNRFVKDIFRFIRFIYSYNTDILGFNWVVRKSIFIKEGIKGAINDNSVFCDDYLQRIIDKSEN
ncbi:MAG: asparagine synthetase B family protein [Clostridium sp.]|nr:asparagine synthetase B family protein [Clostridium sp.]MDU7084390.1 asparagine synthetase B family protein [Clostridium sp.]